MSSPAFLFDGPEHAEHRLIFAHGAGAPMDSPFMDAVASGLAAYGVRVARFEFPYMRLRRETGSKRPPDREPRLLEAWREAFAALPGTPAVTAIGGKSMGGRIASMVADELGARALLCFGYPFHAPGRSGSPRIAHLQSLQTPALIIQGTRDPFGGPSEVPGYALSPAVQVNWIEDGDHDLAPRKSSGRTHEQNLEGAIAAAGAFLASIR